MIVTHAKFGVGTAVPQPRLHPQVQAWRGTNDFTRLADGGNVVADVIFQDGFDRTILASHLAFES